MRSYTSLAILGLASTALTSAAGIHNHILVEVRQIAARVPQGDSSADACASSARALMTDEPTPAPSLVSYMMTASATDLCQLNSQIPKSLTSAWSSLESAESSWISKHSSDLQDFISSCEDGSQASAIQSLISAFASGTPKCAPNNFAARPTSSLGAAVAM